jgi:hypothetical protein
MDTTTVLFSPKHNGTTESWNWVCAVTNGRCASANLNEQQQQWAKSHGYLWE